MIEPAVEIGCTEIAQYIGDRIRVARIAKGLSQARLAQMIGHKSSATVNRFENGERPPTIEQLLRIQAAIDLDVVKMFRELAATPAAENDQERQLERELLVCLIKAKADHVEDPVLNALIDKSIHQLDDETLKSLLAEMNRTGPANRNEHPLDGFTN